jgi:hypothetical protein
MKGLASSCKLSPLRFGLEIMATYSKGDFERIAAAIGKDADDVMQHESCFEAAAVWYRSDSGAPKAPNRIAPSTLNKKMTQIANAARKLLRHLEIHDPGEAEDGPGAIALLEYLASAEDNDEDAVIRATARIGRLVEVLDSIDAARELEQRAEMAAEDALKIGALIVPKGHQGNAPVNDWIAGMMGLFKQITGQNPGVSIGAPGTSNGGVPGGPTMRFLEAAGKPLGIELTPDSWCGRIRDLRSGGRKK